jgi:CcmD family protein
MKKILTLLTGAILMVTSNVQAQQEVEMADSMRSSGKIYIVVAMILIVLAGLVVYLFLLDRKLKKLEQELNK